MIVSLVDLMETCQSRLTKFFNFYLQKKISEAPLLQQAMHYAVSNGGKYLRPLLVYATGHIFNASLENLDIPACAVELIHSYSLIHDDLPPMDNAELRRGKPACHKAFTEAMAILAGDALQPLAYEIIARHPSNLNTAQRLAMIDMLAHASGLDGMAAGQALDIMGVDSLPTLEHMYALKTGALFSSSVRLGMLVADIKTHPLLEKFAETVGFAFQIQDDLLDLESNSAITGKPAGLDATNKKVTYPALMGITRAQEKVQALLTQAIYTLEPFEHKADLLRELVYSILQRKK
ncbi:MAG: ispA [Gammaproteobacteria bacterium]|jgi:farnesyl diphosphate synthase|nr:ispA [Gammaproteobacteria bacterium]